MSALLDTAYAAVYPDRHLDCLRNDAEAAAEAMRAFLKSHATGRVARALDPKEYRYGSSCMRCGGSPSGRDSRGGFVGRCNCGAGQ